MVEVAEFLKPALLATEDFVGGVCAGELEGSLMSSDRDQYVVWPANDDPAVVCLDGQWTAAELRAIADHIERFGA